MTRTFLPSATAARLAQQHEVLYTLLETRGEQDVARRPEPGKWSILENIAHLAAYQQVFTHRVRRILAEDNPAIPAYVGDNDPHFLEAREQPVADVLADLSADRLYLCDWITSLDAGQLSRRATHPRYGPRSLLSWTEFFLLHEAHHLYTIWKVT